VIPWALALAAVAIAVAAAVVACRARAQVREVRRALGELDAREPAVGAVVRALREETARAEHAGALTRRLRDALEEAADGVVVVDEDGTEVLRNAVARRMGGARPGEVLADDAVSELLHRALGGEACERELALYGPPRQVLRLRARPLRDGGRVVGAVAFAVDVSDARRVESVRRDFVANVSHELKTPIGALALLAETIASSDDPVVMRQLADRVVREADRLARIVEDLLDLSLIEAQEAPSREPIPLPLLVSEAVEAVEPAALTAAVPIEVSPRPPHVEIVCDHRQMRSALVNLLDNAVKYSAKGETVEIGARLEGERVAVVVRDHGIGIPSRDLERIFERFYRVDRARSRETGGTGLGLSIVRHVAQAHGGEIQVESHEGEGSTFTLYVPLSGGLRTQSEAT
jgi:two-component system sensor histidine kinase SenX3